MSAPRQPDEQRRLDVEQLIVAGLLMFGSSAVEQLERLSFDGEALLDLWHVHVFRAGRLLVAKSMPISMPGVVDEMRRYGRAELVWGVEVAISLALERACVLGITLQALHDLTRELADLEAAEQHRELTALWFPPGHPALDDAAEQDADPAEGRTKGYLSEPLPGRSDASSKSPSTSNDATRSKVAILIYVARSAELFHAHDGKTYATVPINSHHETWGLESAMFREWLTSEAFRRHSVTVSESAVRSAIMVLNMRAREAGARGVHLRVARGPEGEVYVDLGDEGWRVVRISPAAWNVISGQAAPVCFRRAGGMRALPDPERGGTLSELRAFLNVTGDEQWSLIAAWLVAACMPDGPHPVLCFFGEHGTAKSSAARILRSLVDPNELPVRATSSDPRNLFLTANNSWTLAFDNVSGPLPAWLSDALCQLSTGGGFAIRKNYTDDEETMFKACRPVILTSIDDAITRGDLRDRSIQIDLPVIPPKQRRDEDAERARFMAAQRRILGGLLDAVAAALRRLPSIRPEEKPRMADFYRIALAAEPAFGVPEGVFARAYADMQRRGTAAVLEEPFVAEVIRHLHERRGGVFEGSATELLAAVGGPESTPGWPRTPRGVSAILKRCAPDLRLQGIDVRLGEESTRGTGGKRLIRIRRTAQ